MHSAGGDLINVRGRTQYPGVHVQGIVPVEGAQEVVPDRFSGNPARLSPLSMRLAIGREPKGLRRVGTSVVLPDRLKPSPLRLIYRNLHDTIERIDADTVLFSFVDFDPY
jgi:hypothetical protein